MLIVLITISVLHVARHFPLKLELSRHPGHQLGEKGRGKREAGSFSSQMTSAPEAKYIDFVLVSIVGSYRTDSNMMHPAKMSD